MPDRGRPGAAPWGAGGLGGRGTARSIGTATNRAHVRLLGALGGEFRLRPGHGGTTLVVDERPLSGLVARKEVAGVVETVLDLRNRVMVRRVARVVDRSGARRRSATAGAPPGTAADG